MNTCPACDGEDVPMDLPKEDYGALCADCQRERPEPMEPMNEVTVANQHTPGLVQFTFNDWTEDWETLREITVEEGGKRISFSSGGPNEEGYSYTVREYWAEDGIVYRREITQSKDCDGRIDRECVTTWDGETYRLDDTVLEYGQPLPHWERQDASQRDYSAEAAGY